MKTNTPHTDAPQIIKANALIDARYKLSLREMKIILSMIAKISPGDKDFKEYRLYIKDFIEQLEIKGSDQYTASRKATKNLMGKVLEIDDGDRLLQVGFLSSAVYRRGTGYVDFRFDPNLKRYLLQLREKFTRYSLEVIIQCRSMYAIRLYEILKSWEGLKQRTIPLPELKRMLNIGADQYPRFQNLRERVLEKARRELKRVSSDIYFNFKPIKEGARIVAVRFTIKPQEQPNLPLGGTIEDHVQEVVQETQAIEIRQRSVKEMRQEAVTRYQALTEKQQQALERQFVSEIVDTNSQRKRLYDKTGINAGAMQIMWHDWLAQILQDTEQEG